jgi:hypothetical protein
MFRYYFVFRTLSVVVLFKNKPKTTDVKEKVEIAYKSTFPWIWLYPPPPPPQADKIGNPLLATQKGKREERTIDMLAV